MLFCESAPYRLRAIFEFPANDLQEVLQLNTRLAGYLAHAIQEAGLNPQRYVTEIVSGPKDQATTTVLPAALPSKASDPEGPDKTWALPPWAVRGEN
jgi:hypothetical protein